MLSFKIGTRTTLQTVHTDSRDENSQLNNAQLYYNMLICIFWHIHCRSQSEVNNILFSHWNSKQLLFKYSEIENCID